MKEITFYGRGGQGAVVASEILAEAYFKEGYHVQSFPSFGVERRGAPVTAFLRIDREFIYLRCMIYKADMAIVLSPDIVNSPTFEPSLKNDAVILVNSKEKMTDLSEYRSFFVDATGIALDHELGSSAQPLVNTALLGGVAKISGDLSLDNMLKAIEELVPQKTEQNIQAARKAYESVVGFE